MTFREFILIAEGKKDKKPFKPKMAVKGTHTTDDKGNVSFKLKPSKLPKPDPNASMRSVTYEPLSRKEIIKALNAQGGTGGKAVTSAIKKGKI